MAAGEDVYCTLVLSDAYLPGAAVLAHSLRDSGTEKKLACMIDQSSLRASTVEELQSLYHYVIPIQRIGNPHPANLYLMGRPDLLYTFTKLHLWRLVQFRKIVYIDADVVALRAPDELFHLPEPFAAAPDVGWPDAFNTGVMVVTPHMGEHAALHTLAAAGDSFDGADQGLLNQYFEHRPWKRLSFVYNCTPSANYQYEPAYRYYKRDISLVHFIGAEKPWQQERGAGGRPGAYQELLGRWWAVYDRHFKVSTSEYISGQQESKSYAVQQQMKSESHGYYATGYPVKSTGPAPPEAQATTTEAPFSEPGEKAENIDQGLVEPTPTIEVRRFSAPHVEWDATRAAPPQESKPEAANFPTTSYEFSTDPQPFRPPPSYPDPPKDMWYEVPKDKPKAEEKPPPIFPWEEREVPTPTRKFVDDAPLPPPPVLTEQEPDLEPEFAGADELEVHADEKVEPKTPTLQAQGISTWEVFATTNKNAWDEVSGIDEYVRALTSFQRNRGKTQVIHTAPPSAPATLGGVQQVQQHILSPSNEPDPEELVEKVRQRRESLILTDFPSAVERPSLPVTPAPRRRSTFWGAERSGEDEAGDAMMPPAEGVPEQADWNPSAQLEQLRRNSLLVGPDALKLPLKKDIPKRTMPASSAPAPNLAQPVVDTEKGLGSDAPPVPKLRFSEPDFGAPVSSTGQEEAETLVSPTATAGEVGES